MTVLVPLGIVLLIGLVGVTAVGISTRDDRSRSDREIRSRARVLAPMLATALEMVLLGVLVALQSGSTT